MGCFNSCPDVEAPSGPLFQSIDFILPEGLSAASTATILRTRRFYLHQLGLLPAGLSAETAAAELDAAIDHALASVHARDFIALNIEREFLSLHIPTAAAFGALDILCLANSSPALIAASTSAHAPLIGSFASDILLAQLDGPSTALLRTLFFATPAAALAVRARHITQCLRAPAEPPTDAVAMLHIALSRALGAVLADFPVPLPARIDGVRAAPLHAGLCEQRAVRAPQLLGLARRLAQQRRVVAAVAVLAEAVRCVRYAEAWRAQAAGAVAALMAAVRGTQVEGVVHAAVQRLLGQVDVGQWESEGKQADVGEGEWESDGETVVGSEYVGAAKKGLESVCSY